MKLDARTTISTEVIEAYVQALDTMVRLARYGKGTPEYAERSAALDTVGKLEVEHPHLSSAVVRWMNQKSAANSCTE